MHGEVARPPAVERGDLDEERCGDDVAPIKVSNATVAAAVPGGEDVVDDEHPLTRSDRVGMDLEGVGAVLELVGLPSRWCAATCRFARNHATRPPAGGRRGRRT